ncbi:MAG: cell division protein FtsA [Endomicrobium sp.]|jgi:cell division protein FtsA|nr:cell division protein FtsA [Endomicrobium sp.]
MAKQVLIAGLDIGSNQVCCVAGARDEEARIVKILGAACVPCSDGIKAGAVINIQEAALAIARAFEDTEKAAGAQTAYVVASLRGGFIEAKNSRGVANINHANREITEETVANALDSAKKIIKLDSEHVILQIVPREFILNQQKGIQNPIGMEGTFIEVDVHALVAVASNVANISKAMESVGIKCDEKVYGYLAASDILVTKEEKELGCLAVDFGGLTTGLVYYADGIVRYSSELQVGSDYITRDIMHKLRASFAVSREIKEMYGAVFASKDMKSAEFEYRGADGRSSKKYDRAQLVEIIQPRIEQILFAIEDIMKRSPSGAQFLSGGIVLTGGGSLLEGVPEAFEKYFGCSVRIGIPNPEKVVGPHEIVSNPSYTAAIGAVSSTLSVSYSSYVPRSSSPGVVSKIIKWFDETF